MERADGAALPDITLQISVLVKGGVYPNGTFQGPTLNVIYT